MPVGYAKNKSVASVRMKLLIALCVGMISGGITDVFWKWQIALLLAWDVSMLVYLAWTWSTIWPMDGPTTARHAVREDPSRGVSDTVLLCTLIGSLVAVGFLLAESSSHNGVRLLFEAVFGVLSIVISWVVLHTLFMLRYAEEYYTKPEGGVDFGDTKHPSYHDFAYLAFTIGMTFQVSDTQLGYKRVRRTALRHALISYIFGTLIIAATVNLVAGLGK